MRGTVLNIVFIILVVNVNFSDRAIIIIIIIKQENNEWRIVKD